ncbi:hypothetical protein ACFLT2_09290 [Acidobacteriota bacterium]
MPPFRTDGYVSFICFREDPSAHLMRLKQTITYAEAFICVQLDHSKTSCDAKAI